MIVLINGPLGIGKSSLAEALTECIDDCAMLDGDRLVAVNPPHPDALEFLHSTIRSTVEHHRRFGYRHFIIDSFWGSPSDLDDLRSRLGSLDPDIRCFVLTLPLDDNFRRIERRASVRVIDELELERATVVSEREMLAAASASSLGEPFDVSAPLPELVERLLRRLGLG